MSLPEVRTLEYVCPHCGGSKCLDVECEVGEDDASIADDLAVECPCRAEKLHAPAEEWWQ